MKLPLHIDNDTHRGMLMVAIFAVAGIGIGILTLPASSQRVDPTAPGPNFTLLGQRIPSSTDADERAVQLVRRYANENIAVKTPDGGQHLFSRTALGAQVHRSRLVSLLEQIRDPASPLRRHAAHRRLLSGVAMPVTVSLNDERAIATLLDLKDYVDRPAVDARLDLDKRQLLPEQHGVQLDIYGTLARLQHAVRTGQNEIEAVVVKPEPRLKAEQLGNVTFDHVLGYFETAYARGSKHELRTFNLRLAASRLDGHVVLPGEVFDFNEVVGPRDEAHGYKIAPVIAEGELVDGIGGGTCQISGTLHAAAYFAGLEIVSRRPHTRPSSYIKMGLDAAVSYPTITLRLKNNFSFPVVVHETVRDGVVRAEILGPRRDLTVTFVRKILEVLPYQEVERADSKLPAGARMLSQRGVPGFRVQKHRILRDGPFAVRERTVDSYPPTAQIVRVGTGDSSGDAVSILDDQHPEYTADEYLTVTQGPGILTRGVERDVPGGPMVENRVPGKTGKSGWTVTAGFPVFAAIDARKEIGENRQDSRQSESNE